MIGIADLVEKQGFATAIAIFLVLYMTKNVSDGLKAIQDTNNKILTEMVSQTVLMQFLIRIQNHEPPDISRLEKPDNDETVSRATASVLPVRAT